MLAAAQPTLASTLKTATGDERDVLKRIIACQEVRCLLTYLDPPPPKPESGEGHLAQAKSSAEHGEKANRCAPQKVEEYNDQDRIKKADSKERFPQSTNGERGNHHVGGNPLR